MSGDGGARAGDAMPAIEPHMTVHQVLEIHPGTLGTFNVHGIDSCCGGGIPVVDAARRHGVDPEELLRELRRAAESGGS